MFQKERRAIEGSIPVWLKEVNGYITPLLMWRRCLYSIILVALALIVHGQPILTYADDAPMAGTQYQVFHGGGISPGPIGPNAVYNFIGFVPDDTTWVGYEWSDSTTTYFGCPFYDTINLAGPGGCYRLVDTALHFFSCGFYGTTPIISWDSRQILRFPMEYGDSFIDYWDFELLGLNPSPCGGFGPTFLDTVEIDGYGLLALPSGVVGPVLRVRRDTWNITPNNEDLGTVYRYYLPGIRYPVAEISGSDTAWSASLIDPNTVGISEVSGMEEAIQLSPIPATDELIITRSPGSVCHIPVHLYTMDGSMVQSQTIANAVNAIDIRGLSPGVYGLATFDCDGRQVFKRFVKTDDGAYR